MGMRGSTGQASRLAPPLAAMTMGVMSSSTSVPASPSAPPPLLGGSRGGEGRRGEGWNRGRGGSWRRAWRRRGRRGPRRCGRPTPGTGPTPWTPRRRDPHPGSCLHTHPHSFLPPSLMDPTIDTPLLLQRHIGLPHVVKRLLHPPPAKCYPSTQPPSALSSGPGYELA